jgi:CTP:molybdopterin cytidylyltransferase MocA
MRVLDAVVMAGAPNDGRLKEVSDEAYEALIELQGKPLVRYSVEALIAARTVDRIVVVGPKPELEGALTGLDAEVIPPVEGMLENALHGCRYLVEKQGGKRGLILLATADGPLITADIIDGLVRTCLEMGGDVFYPVLERSAMEARFPATRRTYAKLKDGTFTGGNLVVVDSAVLEREAETAMAFVRGRKNPLKLARTLGLAFIFKLVFGLLTVPELEAYVSKTFNLKARAVIAPWAEIGIDVDKPEDLELVRSYLAKSSGG